MKAKIISVKSLLSSKTGKPFTVLQLQDPQTGMCGDFADFTGIQYSDGEIVDLVPELYQYKWRLAVKKV